MKTWIEAIVAALLFAGIASYHQSVVPVVLYAVGRGPNCDLRASAAAIQATDEQEKYFAELQNQIALVRTEGKISLWNTPEGEIWFSSTSKRALAMDMAEQRRGIYSPFGLGARKGDVVLDCGANAGLYTKTALRNGASLVVAIEPAPDNLECLRRNLKAEIAEGKVVVVPKGVWDKEDFLEMYLDAENAAGDSFVIRRMEGKEKLRLPLTTIDRLAGELGLSRIDYIKMDIEGAERKALDGARETIGKYHPRMALCIYHLRDDPPVIREKVKKLWAGYDWACGPCRIDNSLMKPEVYFFH